VGQAEQAGYCSVVVLKTRRLRGGMAKNMHAVVSNADNVPLKDIVSIMETSLQIRTCRVGDTVFEQKTGSPIGGLLSKAHATMACGLPEHKWQEDVSGYRSHEFSLQDCGYKEAVASKRYVDDVCTISGVLCRSCMDSLNEKIYPSEIAFGIEQRSTLAVTWLDVQVEATNASSTPEICMAPVEFEWLLDGNPHPKKQRFPPCLGRESIDVSDFRQGLRAIAARWSQVGLSERALRIAICNWVAILDKLGYEKAMVYRMFKRVGGPMVAKQVSELWPDGRDARASRAARERRVRS